MDNYISIGKILNFHGIKGEAKVAFSPTQKDFLQTLKKTFVRKNGEFEELCVASVRFSAKTALIKFKGIETINDLLEYKGLELYVPKDALLDDLEKDEFLIDDLIGLDAVQGGKTVGKVTAVKDNSAAFLLEIKTADGREVLVPFVNAIVPEINLKEGTITLNEIEGLL